MSSSLIVLTGPPLPGRWALARALQRRCAARRFVVDAGSVPLIDITRALSRDGCCVLVDGDLPTPESRHEVLDLHERGARLLVEWQCDQRAAEKEVFHRYASRPAVLARAEFERYRADVERRIPVGNELSGGTIVRTGPKQTLDEQVARVVAALGRPLPASSIEPVGGRRVMVVEDDYDERSMLAEVLEELGFQVELAPDAGVAMALLDDGADVELLISDQQMPGMSGVELTRELKERHPQVRTVLLTGFGDETLCHEAMQAHAVTVLSKPLRVIDLERVLDEASF
jgi:CheY-like chemotaxis protein